MFMTPMEQHYIILDKREISYEEMKRQPNSYSFFWQEGRRIRLQLWRPSLLVINLPSPYPSHHTEGALWTVDKNVKSTNALSLLVLNCLRGSVHSPTFVLARASHGTWLTRDKSLHLS